MFSLQLVVDSFGVWNPSSVEALRSVARTSTVRNVGTSFHYLVERFNSILVVRYNAKIMLHVESLHPHLEDD